MKYGDILPQPRPNAGQRGLQDQSGDAPDDGRPQSGRAEARCRREIGELASKVGEQ
jgi:hypothetical protein